MTDDSYVHYVLVIDRSGSMNLIKNDMQGGLRSFVGLQLEGVDGSKRTVSLYQFDTEHEKLLDFGLLKQVTDYELVPRGGTALLDAVGQAVTEVGEKLAAMPEHERPGYVMVVIVTDGQENSSRTYTRARVKDMIQHQQEKYGWQFTYIGAGQDDFTEAGSIGIARGSTLSYTPQSTSDMWDVASAAVSGGTVSTSTGIHYTRAQRSRVSRTGGS